MRLKAFSLAVAAQRNGRGIGGRGVKRWPEVAEMRLKSTKRMSTRQLSRAREVAQHWVGSFEGIFKESILLLFINIIVKFRWVK